MGRVWFAYLGDAYLDLLEASVGQRCQVGAVDLGAKRRVEGCERQHCVVGQAGRRYI